MSDFIFESLDKETFDHKNDYSYQKDFGRGLTEEVVRKISEDKNEPEWMLEFRLDSFRKYQEMSMPKWGPALDGWIWMRSFIMRMIKRPIRTLRVG